MLWSQCGFDLWLLRYMSNIVDIQEAYQGYVLRRSERGCPIPPKVLAQLLYTLFLAQVLKLLWEQCGQARQEHKPAGEGAGGRQVIPVTATLHRASWLHSTIEHKEIISEKFGIYQKYILRQFDHCIIDLPIINIVLFST